MRALLVVLATKRPEATLLRGPTRRRRPRGSSLERPMHPLVPAVLRRTAGLRALRHDPQANPPDRQPRQAARPSSGRRTGRRYHCGCGAAAQIPGTPPRAPRASGRSPSAQRPTRQQIPTAPVHHRQGIAPRPIAGAKLALEIDRPDGVRDIHRRRRPGGDHTRRPPPPRRNQPVGLENRARRARRRPGLVRRVQPQPLDNVTGPQSGYFRRIATIACTSAGGVACGWLCGRRDRGVNPARAFRVVPPDQLIAGRPTNPVPPAQRGERPPARADNPPQTVPARPWMIARATAPRTSVASLANLSTMSPVRSVKDVAGLYPPSS